MRKFRGLMLVLVGGVALATGWGGSLVARAADSHQGEVYTNLVPGQFSCAGPNNPTTATSAGEFTAVPVNDGTGQLEVAILLRNAEPNADYDVTYTCHVYLNADGSYGGLSPSADPLAIVTNSKGVGNVTFFFTPVPGSPSVVFDGYVAPQSFANGGPVGPGYFETSAVPTH